MNKIFLFRKKIFIYYIMDNSNNLVLSDDKTPSVFQNGQMTEEGLICEDGTFIPRYKRENRPGLTDEDEEKIALQTKAYHQLHPNMSIGIIDMIMLWNHRDPEGCEAYVKKRREEKKNITPEDIKKEFDREKFPEMKDYERVY
tara:strand:+ start:1850 stop:2278 length:429 start_codon:yes stop_codon:yes gene_type:complete